MNDTLAQKYNALSEAIKKFANFKMEEINVIIDELTERKGKKTRNAQFHNTLLSEIIKLCRAVSAGEADTTKKAVLANSLSELIGCLEKEADVYEGTHRDDEKTTLLYDIMASYRRIFEGRSGTESAASSLGDFNAWAEKLTGFLLQTNKQALEFRPLVGIVALKTALGVFLAVFLFTSVVLKAFIDLYSVLSEVSKKAGKDVGLPFFDFFINNKETLGKIAQTTGNLLKIVLIALILVSIFDIVRLRIMNRHAKSGDLSAKFSFAYYMSFSPFFLYTVLTFRSNKKMFNAYFVQILDCAELGYIPAVYCAARAYETGYFKTVEKNAEKAIKLFRICSGYKDSDSRLKRLENEVK